MKKYLACITILTMLITFSDVAAFDGHRRGLLLGIGLGVGVVWESASFSYSGFKDEDKITRRALMNDWKIGYAPNDRWEIFVTNKDAYLGNLNSGNGILALGVTKTLKPKTKTFFISGGLGMPYWEEDIAWRQWKRSIGIYGGLGYEFKRHLSVETNLLYGRQEIHGSMYDAEPPTVWKYNYLSLRLVINALAY